MAPVRPIFAIITFAGTLSTFLFGAANPCLLLSIFLLLIVATIAAATAIVYIEDLRKNLILSFGLRQPDEPTFFQYCQHYHPFFSCFFSSPSAWAGRPQRLMLYGTSLWMTFMWSLYSSSKFGLLATETRGLDRCHYWSTVIAILIIPRVCMMFMESMLSFAQSCDDATLVDQVEEKVDILAGAASAVQREAAAEHISYCLLALKNGVLVSFCVMVYVVTLLGLSVSSHLTSFFVWFSFTIQFALAMAFDTLQTFIVYYYSTEYGELPYLRGRSNMDRYYTDDADIDDLDAQNAMHEEIGL